MQEHLSAFTYHSVHVYVCTCRCMLHTDSVRGQINYVCGLLINELTMLKLFHLVFINLYKLYDEEHEGGMQQQLCVCVCTCVGTMLSDRHSERKKYTKWVSE